MNETILTQRQTHILNIINSEMGLLREEIKERISAAYRVSKPTLIRDLNQLVKFNSIRIDGSGKATRYYPSIDNLLLRPFNLERYFADEPDKRINARTSFNFSILENLHSLVGEDEIKNISSGREGFEVRIAKLPPDIVKRELERFTIEFSWKSSKIEGNTYSLLETEALLKEQKEATGRSREETLMILNHKAAFEVILNNRKSFRKVTLSDINQLHEVLTRGMNVSSGIRRHAVGITGTVYLPLDNQHQIREVYEKTMNLINRNPNPWEKALIAHVMIPYIQPYADGNKRTARMATNAILLAYGLYPISYRSVDEEEFKEALILFYEQGSIYHSKRLFLEQISFAYENYFR